MKRNLLLAAFAAASLCGIAQRHVPMTLQQIFEAADANNSSLRASTQAEQVADAGVEVARARRLPDIETALSVSYIGDGFTTARNYSDYQRAPIPHLGTGLSVNVNQPLYTGGALTAGIEMARHGATAARYDTHARRNEVRLALAANYFDICKLTNMRKVVEGNIASARKVLEQMHERQRQGTVLRNDIVRYELLVSNLQLRLTNIDSSLDILNEYLAVNAGLPVGTVIEPDTAMLAEVPDALPRQYWQQEAEANAPGLKLAENALRMSRTKVSLSQADMRPGIGIKAGWTMDGPILTEVPPINRNLSYWFVGLGVSYKLSSLYKIRKDVARSRASVTVAENSLDETRRQLGAAVDADCIRLDEARHTLRTRQKAVELALTNYNTVAMRYDAGMALITDLLDAADARLDAEQNLVNARIDIIYSHYKLLYTTGKI